MLVFSQSFGQTFDMTSKDLRGGDVFIIGRFQMDKKDGLYHYEDMKSRKYDFFDFLFNDCEEDCHFFAYAPNPKPVRFYFYNDKLIGYVQLAVYSDYDYWKTLKKNVKTFNVPKVYSESTNDIISETYKRMESEYQKENAAIIENQRLTRERFVKDSTEQVRIKEQKMHEYRQTHDWHISSIDHYLECSLCERRYDLKGCYIAAIDSHYCYYYSKKPSIKMLGVEYKELHRSRISDITIFPDVKSFLEIWRDTIANPQCNPPMTRGIAEENNQLEYIKLCDTIKKIAPFGFIMEYGWELNSVDGVEPYFKYFNTSTKTIKYVDFYFSIYNAVNDICLLDHNTIGNVRGVGPVETFDSGTWNWDRATHYTSSDAVRMKVIKVIITYMDGSTKTLTGDKIIIDTDND